MAGSKRLAINVVMNWAAMAVNMVVPFFLTPFVVRHLGPIGYGVWILAQATVSYLALLDMGLRSAVIRFVSKAQAKGDLQGAREAIHAALWFRLLIGAGVAIISFVLAALMPRLFMSIPPDLVHAAQVTTLLCALGVAVTLIAGVFGAVLAAINRFDLLSYITMSQTLLRAAGYLLILRSGRGLIPLAAWELSVLTLVAVVTTVTALIKFPESRVRPGKPKVAVLRMIWSYSFTTFVFMIAVQIITNTDNLVVGAFLSLSVVTSYAIGGSLQNYAYQVSAALSSTFVPMASNLEASGQMEKLRRMLLYGTQATLALALPIATGLFFRGGTFIRLWMGPQYQVVSENVVRILMWAMYLGVADSTAGSIMMAIEKHKPMTRWAVYEAVLNLILSVILVRTKSLGLYGVALGTSLSMTFTHLCFWPRYVQKTLQVPVRTFLLQGWGRITLCTVPFAVACALTEKYWPADHLITFFAEILAILPVYVLSVFVGFRKESMELIAKWRASRQTAVLQMG